MDNEEIIYGMANLMAVFLTELEERNTPITKALKEDLINTKDKTELILKLMFIQNTGCHPLDSGYAFGYGWSHNRKHWQWKKLEAWAWIEGEGEYRQILTSINTYHYLSRILIRDRKSELLELAFYEYARKKGYTERSLFAPWLKLMRDWIHELKIEELEQIVGHKIEEFETYGVVNTYNHEMILDHVLQFIGFSFTYRKGEWLIAEDYVLLQIHLGADVRGGYTAPRIFKINGEYIEFISGMDTLEIYLPGLDKVFIYSDGAWWDVDGDRVEEQEIIKLLKYNEKEDILYDIKGKKVQVFI